MERLRNVVELISSWSLDLKYYLYENADKCSCCGSKPEILETNENFTVSCKNKYCTSAIKEKQKELWRTILMWNLSQRRKDGRNYKLTKIT